MSLPSLTEGEKAQAREALRISAEKWRQQAATGKIELVVDIGGEPMAFTFRKPTAREWMEYDAARGAMAVHVEQGTTNATIMKEVLEQSEQLCVRVVNSHSPQQLQDLNDEYLGIFFPLATAIADIVDALRAGAGKASPPRGGA